MQFSYTAYTTERGVFRGKLEAQDKTEVENALTSLGQTVLKIGQVKQRPGLEVLFPSMFSAGPKDLILFARQVVAMLGSGGSLLRSLEMAEGQANSRVMRRIIVYMRQTLEGGGSLSDAMVDHPKIFDKLFVSVVRVGEHTGRLGPSLEQLADILEADAEAKAKAIKTMMYPMAIVGMSLVTLAVLVVVAVPPLMVTFEQMGAESPAMTKAAVAGVNFFKTNGLAVITVIGGFIGGMSILRRIPRTAAMADTVLARLPLYGSLLVAGDLARFSRTMSMLLGAGVPLSDSLGLGIAGCKNVRIREAFLAGEASLLAGHGFATELRHQAILPTLFQELMTMGEEGNQLPKMMQDAANTYTREREERLAAVLGALEPLSTVVVGAIVGFIAFAMFVPIYSGLGALQAS